MGYQIFYGNPYGGPALTGAEATNALLARQNELLDKVLTALERIEQRLPPPHDPRQEEG